jgi:hypothetical protein
VDLRQALLTESLELEAKPLTRLLKGVGFGK